MKLVSIDIETKPAPGFESYELAALDHHRNEITQIAWVDSEGNSNVLSGPESINQLNQLIKVWREKGYEFVGQNFKFDLKTLITKGADFSPDDYKHDTMLQSVANPDKIPDRWLADYEMQRKIKNKELGKQVHREAGQNSLKSLAPYHLGVEPFWEVENHDNAEYAAKDAKYTLDLYIKQKQLLEAAGAQKFYSTKLMRWAQMILRAELRGIKLDLEKLEIKAKESEIEAEKARNTLIDLWQEPFEAYHKLQLRKTEAEYAGKEIKALERAKTDKTRLAVPAKYLAMRSRAEDKIEPFNIDSPTQLKWLLKDYYGLDIRDYTGEESTGQEVLARLAESGREDLKHLMSYKEHKKLVSSFYPTYKEMHWEGRIHTSLNLNGTRTGRLSSSEPNMQQVPGALHELFISGEGRKLDGQDLSNIEPVLIAYVTECPVLCRVLIEGGNFHDENVKAFFNLPADTKDIKKNYKLHREMAKEVGLSILYGAGAKRVMGSAQKYGFSFTEAECKQMVYRLRDKYKTIWKFKEKLDQRLERGETVYNLVGRPFKIANKDDVYMKGFNRYIQSSASDLLVESVTQAGEQFIKEFLDATPILLVHDEAIVDASEKDIARAHEILIQKMLGHKLTTIHGDITLKSEGAIGDYWKK